MSLEYKETNSMGNKIRRAAAAVLVLVMMVLTAAGMELTAYAATGKITFSDPTVTVGSQVSVTMKITSTDGIGLGASDVRLQYDSSTLEFVNGTNANGGAGSIRVIGSMEAENQTTFSFTLKFNALKAGNSAVTVTSQEVYDADSKAVTIEHVGSSSVKVKAPETYSKEASLASLTISPGELTPEFSADVTEYQAVVGEDVEKITVSAPAKDSKASVSVSGNEGLQLGENTVTCKVTAEDGTTAKTYTILVTKTEGEAETGEPETETEEIVSAGVGQNVMDGNWQAAETFDPAILPDGFKVTEFVYDGKNVQAGSDMQGSILLYMTNESGEGDFFLYDQASGVLSPYVEINMAEKRIIVLPPEAMPENMKLPEKFKACTIDIGSHTVQGWIWKDESEGAPEYCVVYGRNQDGEDHLYRYDQKEMTLQRYFQDPESESLRTKYEAVANDYNALREDYQMRGWIIIGLIAAAAVLTIVVIVLIILLMRRPKAAEEIEDFDEFVPTERRRAERTWRQEEYEPELPEEDLTDFDEPEIGRRVPEEKKKEEEEDDDELEIIDLDL